MTLVNPNAHNIKIFCSITIAGLQENVCTLSNHWSTFTERVDDEYWVDPEIGKMIHLDKGLNQMGHPSDFSICSIPCVFFKWQEGNFRPLRQLAIVRATLLHFFARQQVSKHPVRLRKIWHLIQIKRTNVRHTKLEPNWHLPEEEESIYGEALHVLQTTFCTYSQIGSRAQANLRVPPSPSERDSTSHSSCPRLIRKIVSYLQCRE